MGLAAIDARYACLQVYLGYQIRGVLDLGRFKVSCLRNITMNPFIEIKRLA